MPINTNPWNSWNYEPGTLQGQPAIKPFSLQKPAPTPFSQMQPAQRPAYLGEPKPKEYPWWQRMMGFGAKYMPTEEWLPKATAGVEKALLPFTAYGIRGKEAVEKSPWEAALFYGAPAISHIKEGITGLTDIARAPDPQKKALELGARYLPGSETYKEYQELPWYQQIGYEAPMWAATAVIPGAMQARAALAPAAARGGIRGGAAIAARGALAPMAGFEWAAGKTLHYLFGKPVGAAIGRMKEVHVRRLWQRTEFYKGIKPEFRGTPVEEDLYSAFKLWHTKTTESQLAAKNVVERVLFSEYQAGRYGRPFTAEAKPPVKPTAPLELPTGVKPTPPTKPVIPETMITPPPAVTGVPMTITKAMEGQLGKMGYSASAIAKMTPEEAWNILYKPRVPEVKTEEVAHLRSMGLDEKDILSFKVMSPELRELHIDKVRLARFRDMTKEDIDNYIQRLRDIVLEKAPDKISEVDNLVKSLEDGNYREAVISSERALGFVHQAEMRIPKAEPGMPEAVVPVAGAVTPEAIRPPIEAKATNDQLAEAYNIAKSKLYINPKTNKPKPQYLRVAKSITGKTDIAKMTEAEAGEFIEALKRLPRPSYKQGKLVPPTIPITKRVTPENYFDITFKEPTIAKYLTSQTYYAQKLGVKPLVEPLEVGKQRLDLVFQAMKNTKDQKISQIDKIGGTTAAQRIRAKIKNEPTEAVARMRDLLDTYEEAPAFLTAEERELFNWIRNLTRTIIDGENQAYRLLGMDEIPYRQAYIPHRANLMAEEILAGNHPLPNALSYWSSKIVGKKIFNQAEMQRQLAGDLENLFSKDLNYLLDSMLWTGLKVIHLSQPLNSFTQQMGAFDKDLPQYKDLPPEELARLKSISVMPASTKSWVTDYVNQVIKGQQTFLDAEINRLVTQSGIGGLVDKALRPFGRTLGQRPVTQLSKFIGRLMIFSVMGPRPGLIRMIGRNFLQATQDLALYPIKANLKGYLPATENLKRMQDKSLYLKSYTGLEELPPGIMSKAEKAGLKPYRLSAVFNYSKSQRKAYWASLELIEKPKHRGLGWADPQRTYTEPKEFVYPSEEAKVLYEIDFGPGAAQYQYIGMAMPEIFRHKTLIPLTRLQSWWMNHFFRFHAEAMHRAFKGTTSYGAKIPWSWRLNYLKYLIFGGAILTSLGYTSSYLAGVLPRSQSPAAQFIMGLYQYVTSDSEWEQSKAKRQIYNSWRTMVPGALTYKEFNDIWTGERPLWTTFFYGREETGPPPHKPSWGIPALLPKDPYQRIEDEVWSQYPGSVKRLSDKILELEKTDPREARRLLFENPQVGSQILEARRKIAIAKAKLKREEAIEEREKIMAGR